MTTERERSIHRQQGLDSDAHAPATTRGIYRQLVSLGLNSGEAVQLTAYLHGLRTSVGPWTLTQINALLFLRELRHAGLFGRDDGSESGARRSLFVPRPAAPSTPLPVAVA
jgi:hypothetical protein